jgi:hypothetical protein
MNERPGGYYWVDFGWETGPVVALWLTADQVAASFAGSIWKLPPGVKHVGRWQLPSDENEQQDGPNIRVLGERLEPPKF